MAFQIIPFEPRHGTHFRDLNLSWLQRYFYVEPKDKELLDDAKGSILDKEGYIFMAEWNQTPVGCYALLPLGANTFELGKMAVHPEYQGLKIGQRLLEHALGFARDKGWNRIVLYSSNKLHTALHVYRKFGFTEIPLEKDLPYARSDVKMEYKLS